MKYKFYKSVPLPPPLPPPPGSATGYIRTASMTRNKQKIIIYPRIVVHNECEYTGNQSQDFHATLFFKKSYPVVYLIEFIPDTYVFVQYPSLFSCYIRVDYAMRLSEKFLSTSLTYLSSLSVGQIISSLVTKQIVHLVCTPLTNYRR